MTDTGQGSTRQPAGFLRRHRSALIWLAVAGFILWLRWPMLKGSFYRFFGGPAPADGIAWQTDLETALLEAARTGKPLLLDFSASWCPPCQVMKHDVWPAQQVRQAVQARYIPVLLDVDAASSREAAQRYKVNAVPTILVVDPQGRVLRQGGYMSRAEMIDFLGSPSPAPLSERAVDRLEARRTQVFRRTTSAEIMARGPCL